MVGNNLSLYVQNYNLVPVLDLPPQNVCKYGIMVTLFMAINWRKFIQSYRKAKYPGMKSCNTGIRSK